MVHLAVSRERLDQRLGLAGQRYLNNTTVIGMDLRNEPHNDQSGGSCWGCGTDAL